MVPEGPVWYNGKLCNSIASTTVCPNSEYVAPGETITIIFKDIVVNYIVKTTTPKVIFNEINIYGDWDSTAKVYHCKFEKDQCSHVRSAEVSYDFLANPVQYAYMYDLEFMISNPLGSFSPYIDFSLKFRTNTYLPKNPLNVLEFDIDYDTNPNFTPDQCYANFSWTDCTLTHNKLRIYPTESVKPDYYEIHIVRALRFYDGQT